MSAMTPSRSSRLNASVKRSTNSSRAAAWASPVLMLAGLLLADQVQRQVALEPPGAMLEDVYGLPGAERQASRLHGYGNLRRGEGGADVARHVVGPLGHVPVALRILRHEPAEEVAEVAQHVRVGVLLDGERRGRVLDEHRQQPGADAAAA